MTVSAALVDLPDGRQVHLEETCQRTPRGLSITAVYTWTRGPRAGKVLTPAELAERILIPDRPHRQAIDAFVCGHLQLVYAV